MNHRRTAFNLLAAACVLLPIALWYAEDSSPFGADRDRVWIVVGSRSVHMDVPDGSGSRSVFSLPTVIVFFPCLAILITWITIRGRERERKNDLIERPSIKLRWLINCILVWLLVAYFAYGYYEMIDRFSLAMILFVPLSIIGVFLRVISRAGGDGPTRERQRRMENGLCPQCGYSLKGNVSGICPECGTAVEMLIT